MSQVRIKICGITSLADALEATRLGADALGFNFYARSPRSIAVATAADIVCELPPSVEPVGLFVNEPLSAIQHALAPHERLRTIQWHGDTPPLGPRSDYRFIPAFAVQDASSLDKVHTYIEQCRACDALPAALLLDGQRPGLYGGTGQPAPWSLLADFNPGLPLFLAGGLTPENVAEAIRIVRPYAVDVASGVESSPGRKDHDKLRRFIDRAREAAVRL